MSPSRSYFLPIGVALLTSFFRLNTALAAGPSFDCAKAATQVEKTICADPHLSKVDLEMSNEYKYGMTYASPNVKRELEKEQKLWLKERDHCAEKRCLSDAYESRLMRLRSVTAAIDGD